MADEVHKTLEDALVHEVWRQDLVAIQHLLKAGANPNRPGKAGSSAIACAGENDETGDIVRCLVTAGADINLQDSAGWTPLHQAIDVAIDGAAQADSRVRLIGALLTYFLIWERTRQFVINREERSMTLPQTMEFPHNNR